MKKLTILLLGLVLALAFSFTVLADPTSCTDDLDCISLGSEYECDFSINECYDILDFGLGIDGGIENNSAVDNSSNDNSSFEVISNGSEVTIDERLGLLNSRLFALDKRVTNLNPTNENITGQISNLSIQLENLHTIVSELNQNLQLISLEQKNSDDDINVALAGLATLQNELTSTQSEVTTIEEDIAKKEAKSDFVQIISLVVIILVVFSSLLYYFLSHKKHRTGTSIPKNVLRFINQQIKAGKSYSVIKRQLMTKGWSEPDIKTAYDETSRRNYNEYLKSQGKKPKSSIVPPQNNKIIIASLLSIIVITALVFFVSNSTGQATYLPGGIESADQFPALFEKTLDDRILNHIDLFSEIEFMDICVQVVDKELSSSRRIIKTSLGHATFDAKSSCDNDDSYDFAIKFLSWNAFELLSKDFSCSALSIGHKGKNYVILPSKYVALGFTAQNDYQDFCPLITHCFDEEEIFKLNLNC
jgi:hypothetical protein